MLLKPRIHFENGGAPLYFIGSADWMNRNLSARVEAITPIEEPRLKEQLEHILRLSLADHRQAWELGPDGRYRRRFATADEDTSAAQGLQVSLMQETRAFAIQATE